MELPVQNSVLLALAVLVVNYAVGEHDIPCAGRFFKDRSCVCVCNATYCDTVTREPPIKGVYFTYTSSAAGLRFHKGSYYVHPFIKHLRYDKLQVHTLEVDPSVTYQTVEGFGGAVTDSAAINWAIIKDYRLRNHLTNSYCSEYGLKYNMLRVPIGGTDFSIRGYAYNELPEGDVHLQNFTLAPEDVYYKIPFIKSCQHVSATPIHVLSSTWSPPAWMKDSKRLIGYSRLKKEYYQTYADYHSKFIQLYRDYGIPIWGITTTNEPINGLLNIGNMNSLGWSVRGMGEFIQEYLGPTIRKLFPEIKIIGADDQSFLLPLWLNMMVAEHPGALDYIDGVGIHYYFNKITPPEILKFSMEAFPGKFVIATEASEGASEEIIVDFGSWERAENYATDIIKDLTNEVVGWIDWNLCLNIVGGPSWVHNYVDSAIIIDHENGEFYKQPMFYVIGHFSKFVPRGSKRIKVTEMFSSKAPVKYVGFLTPENTIVVIIYNSGPPLGVVLKLYNSQATVYLEAKSITTVEFPNDHDIIQAPPPTAHHDEPNKQ